MRNTRSIALLISFLASAAYADTFTERWYLSAGGIRSGENSYRDRGPGPDRLPYTEDDVALPVDGNAGGTWSFGFFDVDSDGVDEHAFSVVRREDDDAFTLSTWSDFSHGVISEGEMWVDAHHLTNDGPAGNDPTGDDVEWNDRPGWEGESNWLWYNNARADQRGLGGSIYYFEYRDPVAWPDEAFDEVQQWIWSINLKNNTDDGTGIKGDWGSQSGLVIKGLFIPIEAIPDLQDGDLDPLFGWQTIDMATYVRDILHPKLQDENLEVFMNSEGGNGCDTATAFPPTFVMIMQAEARLLISNPLRAEYWGITVDEDAQFRMCSIYLKGDSAENPPIDLLPADGRLLNLWRRDSFVRKSAGDWGAIETPTFECPPSCWEFVDDDQEDCQADWVLRLAGDNGPYDTAIAMPIGRSLDGMDGALVGRARVALEVPEIDGNRVEIILCAGSKPIAWAAVKSGEAPRIGIGGDDLMDSGGFIENPVEESSGDSLVEIAEEGLGYTELEILFDAATTRLELRVDDEIVHTFTYATDVATVADRLWIYSQSEGIDTGMRIDDLSVLQAYALEGGPTQFKRADGNGDGQLDLGDAISILNFLFADGPMTCVDAADVNDDGQNDIGDPIALLNYIFVHGEAPAPPFEACGTDPTPDALDCESFPGCP
ncbi:MAG: hypothetical protein JXP34_10920 [Planctomycetes bacterium]|nr:hypothetical protein [Planctomycetota bacterium]